MEGRYEDGVFTQVRHWKKMNIGEAIPQFFYDLIARVVPGLVFIFCFCFAFGQTYYLKRMMELSTLGLFVLAYVVGAVVHCLSMYCHSKCFKKSNEKYLIQQLGDKSQIFLKKFRDIIKNEMAKEFSSQEGEAGFQELIKEKRLSAIIFIWFDRIRIINSSQGFRIAKIRAEYHMYFSLFSILLIFALIMLVKLIHHGISVECRGSFAIFIIFIILSISGSLYGNRRYRRLHTITVLQNYYNLFIRGPQGSNN